MKRALLPLTAGTCAVWLLALAPARPNRRRRPGFVDVAPQSKISYTSKNSLAVRKYFPQPMCGGVATFDFDNDGRTDIFFTNGAKLPEMKKTDASFFNCLLHQKSDGTFEDVTAKAGLTGEQLDFNLGVAVGDYDNDGYEDLFICSIGRNVLYHNNGDGTFTDVTAASGIGGKPADTLSIAAAWFDYDNDGLLDLIVSNYTIWSPKTDARCMMSDKDFYCDPRRYPSVPLQAVPQSGPWQVRGCDCEVGVRRGARQRHGRLHRRFQRRRLAGRVHRQRYRAQLAVHQPKERDLRGERPGARRGLQRKRASRFFDGLATPKISTTTEKWTSSTTT